MGIVNILLRALGCLGILCLVANEPLVTHAYFHPPELETDIFQEMEEKSTPDPDAPVVMYLFPGGKTETQIFSKGIRNLTPADAIETDFDLYQLFHPPSRPTDDPLASLIYANIELKRLLDQYKAIEESAKEVLAYQQELLIDFTGSYTPLPKDFLASIRDDLQEKLARFEKNETNRLAKASLEKASDSPFRLLGARLKELKTAMAMTVSKGAMFGVLTDNQDGLASDSAAGRGTNMDIHPLSTDRTRIDNSLPSLRSLSYRLSNANSPGRLATRPSSQNRQTDRSMLAEPEKGLKSDIGETPWIIKAPLEFLAWAMKNKIEALLLLLFMLLSLKFLGAIFKRQ
jgi:hypothetical protein